MFLCWINISRALSLPQESGLRSYASIWAPSQGTLLLTVLPLKRHHSCHRPLHPPFRRPDFSPWATGCAHVTCLHPQPRPSSLPSGKPPSYQAILSSCPCTLSPLIPLSSLSSSQTTVPSSLWWPLCPPRPHCPHLSPPVAGICGLLVLLALRKIARLGSHASEPQFWITGAWR